MKKHKSKLIAAVAMVLIFFGGISVGATIRWQGTDEVFNIKDNLTVLRDRLTTQKEKIEELEQELENTISEADHQAIVDQMQKRYENDMAAKDAIIQDYMIKVQVLQAQIADLEAQLAQAYSDVVSIDNEIISILEDTK